MDEVTTKLWAVLLIVLVLYGLACYVLDYVMRGPRKTQRQVNDNDEDEATSND